MSLTDPTSHRKTVLETADEIADVWAHWLTGGEKNRWVRAVRRCGARGITFIDWGTGLPERRVRLMPFCLEAFDRTGKSLGQISKLGDLRALGLSA